MLASLLATSSSAQCLVRLPVKLPVRLPVKLSACCQSRYQFSRLIRSPAYLLDAYDGLLLFRLSLTTLLTDRSWLLVAVDVWFWWLALVVVLRQLLLPVALASCSCRLIRASRLGDYRGRFRELILGLKKPRGRKVFLVFSLLFG